MYMHAMIYEDVHRDSPADSMPLLSSTSVHLPARADSVSSFWPPYTELISKLSRNCCKTVQMLAIEVPRAPVCSQHVPVPMSLRLTRLDLDAWSICPRLRRRVPLVLDLGAEVFLRLDVQAHMLQPVDLDVNARLAVPGRGKGERVRLFVLLREDLEPLLAAVGADRLVRGARDGRLGGMEVGRGGRVGNLGLEGSAGSGTGEGEGRGGRGRTSTRSATAASVAACEKWPNVAYSAGSAVCFKSGGRTDWAVFGFD